MACWERPKRATKSCLAREEVDNIGHRLDQDLERALFQKRR